LSKALAKSLRKSSAETLTGSPMMAATSSCNRDLSPPPRMNLATKSVARRVASTQRHAETKKIFGVHINQYGAAIASKLHAVEIVQKFFANKLPTAQSCSEQLPFNCENQTPIYKFDPLPFRECEDCVRGLVSHFVSIPITTAARRCANLREWLPKCVKAWRELFPSHSPRPFHPLR